MAKVNQRLWKIPGQRTKRKAWGFTAQLPCNPCPHRHPTTGAVLHPDGVRQVRQYKAEWSKDDADAELAKTLLGVEEPKPKTAGLTFGEAAARYLATKSRKRSLSGDRRIIEHLKSELGADTPLAEITPSRISEYKAKRLSSVRRIGKGDGAIERPLSAAGVNRPLAVLRHLLMRIGARSSQSQESALRRSRRAVSVGEQRRKPPSYWMPVVGAATLPWPIWSSSRSSLVCGRVRPLDLPGTMSIALAA